jgi:hypothetical protein
MAIIALVVSGFVFLLLRRFRLKSFGIGSSGLSLEFDRKETKEEQSKSSEIVQEVSAENGEVKQVEQNAEGTGISQKVSSKKGVVKGVKQNAKTSQDQNNNAS